MGVIHINPRSITIWGLSTTHSDFYSVESLVSLSLTINTIIFLMLSFLSL